MKYPCPCCGYLVFDEAPGSYEICPICFWEDDVAQLRFPRMSWGPNRVSLIEAQENYFRDGVSELRFRSNVRVADASDVREPQWRRIDVRADRIEEPIQGKDSSSSYPEDATELYYWRQNVMELTIDQNCSFKMSLVGYQFPELENVEDDSNWLNVKIVVNHERGKWSAVDPALLTYEVGSLIDWLKELSAGKHDKRHLLFTEPCISFHLLPSEGEPDRLAIEFSYEFRPPWAKEITEEHQIAFPLTSIDLMNAAQQLENQLRQYPRRPVR